MAPTTPRAAIIAAARTAIGTARKGTLANMTATELAKPVVLAAIERSGRDVDDFDDLILGEVMQGGGDIARYVAADLGLTGIPGMAVNRQCATSLSAIAAAAGQIAAGMSEALLAGGTESLSTAPMCRKRRPFQRRCRARRPNRGRRHPRPLPLSRRQRPLRQRPLPSMQRQLLRVRSNR